MLTRSMLPVITAFGLTLLAISGAQAQEFPSSTVKIIVPYAPGGGIDNLARPIADRLSRAWGQSVIIENKPGAASMIGGAEVARARPDGHTLLFTSDASITSVPHLFKEMLFDPIKELAPVTQVIDLHHFVLVHPSVAANSMKELVEAAMAKPNAMNYASFGPGTQPHLMFEMLHKISGAEIQQIIYKGTAPAVTATMAGEVQMTLGSVSVAAGHIEAKTLKAIAINRPTRLPAHPQVPTLAEAGYPTIGPKSWFGIFAPAATPPAVVAKIQNAIATIINEPDFKAKYIDSAGHTGVGSTPAEFATLIAEDLAAKREMIAAAGIAAQ